MRSLVLIFILSLITLNPSSAASDSYRNMFVKPLSGKVCYVLKVYEKELTIHCTPEK